MFSKLLQAIEITYIFKFAYIPPTILSQVIFKEIVWHFGKIHHMLTCLELDEQILLDTSQEPVSQKQSVST